MSTVNGLSEIISKLHNLPDKLEKKVLRAAVRQGANIVRDKAREFVRKDTENLKKSIIVSGAKGKPGTIAYRIKPITRKKGKAVFYGYFLEYGTSKMAAKPFMRPAYDEAGEDVINKVIDTVKSKIDEATK